MFRRTSGLVAMVMIGSLCTASVCMAADEPVKTSEKQDALLRVRTHPPGAKVLLDGKELGTSDNVFSIEPDVGTILVELEGHKPNAKQVTIRAKGITRVELTLNPEAKTPSNQLRAQQQVRARERMQQDAKTFSVQERREIESLYQVANQKWQTPEARDSLKTLVEKYKKANRTGCAILYLGQMSQGDDQLAYFKQAIADHSDCFYGDGVQVGAFARFLLGQAYLKSGKAELAETVFDEIRKIYPDSVDHSGNSLVAQIPPAENRGGPTKASGGGDASQLSQQGWQLWQEGQLDEAAARFREAVRLAPNNENAWNGLGWASFNSGKLPEAQKAFERVIALNPNHPAGLNGLGQLYLAQKEYDSAETYLLKAAPQAPAAWYGLARLYLLQGKFEQAGKYAQMIVDSGQGDKVADRMLQAAKEKRLGDGLRIMIEPQPAKSEPTGRK